MTKTKQVTTERAVSYTSPSEEFWTIPTEEGFWHLSDKLIPAMTQDNSAKYSSENGFHALSAEEVFAVMGAMYDLRNAGGSIEKARTFLRQVMRNYFPSTQTRAIYTPSGEDKVIHGYGTESPIERKANLIGPDGEVVKVLSVDASRALTGKTPEEVSELMDYVNGTPSYMWRVNSNPSSNDERVVGLNAGSDRADLYADGDPQGAGPRLGGKFSREALK